ncbi:hypothetical protein GN956_G16975 [Arapaima gigas]
MWGNSFQRVISRVANPFNGLINDSYANPGGLRGGAADTEPSSFLKLGDANSQLRRQRGEEPLILFFTNRLLLIGETESSPEHPAAACAEDQIHSSSPRRNSCLNQFVARRVETDRPRWLPMTLIQYHEALRPRFDLSFTILDMWLIAAAPNGAGQPAAGCRRFKAFSLVPTEAQISVVCNPPCVQSP